MRPSLLARRRSTVVAGSAAARIAESCAQLKIGSHRQRPTSASMRRSPPAAMPAARSRSRSICAVPTPSRRPVSSCRGRRHDAHSLPEAARRDYFLEPLAQSDSPAISAAAPRGFSPALDRWRIRQPARAGHGVRLRGARDRPWPRGAGGFRAGPAGRRRGGNPDHCGGAAHTAGRGSAGS